MKRILAIVMSLVVVFGICVVGTGCDPNKETEAEYKARIKKELDEIPIEATGYKLVDPTKQEVTYPEGEEPKKIWQTFKLDNHTYVFTYSSKDGNIILYIDDNNGNVILFPQNDFFDNYRGNFCCFYYEKKFFIVRFRAEAMHILFYDAFLPHILFYYDIEKNVAEYMGYLKEWFDYKIKDLNGKSSENYLMFTIVKT